MQNFQEVSMLVVLVDLAQILHPVELMLISARLPRALLWVKMLFSLSLFFFFTLLVFLEC